MGWCRELVYSLVGDRLYTHLHHHRTLIGALPFLPSLFTLGTVRYFLYFFFSALLILVPSLSEKLLLTEAYLVLACVCVCVCVANLDCHRLAAETDVIARTRSTPLLGSMISKADF